MQLLITLSNKVTSYRRDLIGWVTVRKVAYSTLFMSSTELQAFVVLLIQTVFVLIITEQILDVVQIAIA